MNPDQAYGGTNRASAEVWEGRAAARPYRARLLFAFDGRSVESRHVTVEPGREPAITDAMLAIVKTKTDDKHGWLAAGQTLARTVLQAQALGLSWAFFSPVRQRSARSALRTSVGHKGFAQVILRFGPLMTGDMVRMAAPGAVTAALQ
jgi:hypothetical protein